MKNWANDKKPIAVYCFWIKYFETQILILKVVDEVSICCGVVGC